MMFIVGKRTSIAAVARAATVLTAVPPCRELLEAYGRSAAGLGFEVGAEATGGSADSGFTAALGTPTLCGTGPVGGNAHRDDEWCRIDTLVPRAQALALTILEVATG
jgi:glutamate carboxypeptidase